ncbi:MAG: sodium:solute symporter family protein [Bacteroidales bacterium]|nr:sodium:solute symporter family protein [Bacteroidales bacterium]
MKLSVIDFSLLIGYALVCILIGFWSSRKNKDEDYLIAGRNMSLVGFVASVVASYVGGAAIVLYSAYVYKFGISAIAVFLGTAAGFLFFIPYALKLRKISSQQKFLTLSDWFYFKYDKQTGIISAIILFVVYFGMLLNQFIAGSSILAHISGLKYETALLISASIITIYLLAGGFNSVIKTDIFQYIILFVLFVLLGVILLKGDHHFTTELADFSRMDPAMTVVFIIFGVLIIFQSAEYWQRVYAAKSSLVVKRGFTWSAVFVIITGLAISIVGLSAHMHVPGIDPKSAFAEGLTVLIPHKFIGASLVLLFAAIMSSADTIIFVLASSVSKDYIANFTKKEINQHNLKNYTRLFILIFAVAGFVMAFFFRDIVTVIVFITGIGFTIIPAAIASFHFNLDKKAVLFSFLSGIVWIIILFLTNNLQAELSIASVAVATIVLVISQLILKSRV